MSLRHFPCEVCGKSFSIKSNLKRHIKIFHSNNVELELFKCEVCSKTFNVRSNLYTHIKTVHSNNRFICEKCGKSFNLRCNLETHIKTLHLMNESLNFACEMCGKTFNIRSNLNRHVRTIHLISLSEKFQCEMCSKTFNVRSNLDIHIKTIHSRDRFSCEICAKTFQLSSKLDSHIKAKHKTYSERKKIVKCLLCGGIFSPIQFKKHLPEVHNIELQTQKLEFKSEIDFQEWKKVVEEQETASYIKTCGSSSSKTYQKIVYYNCHRSGYYKGKFESDRQRALKKQGTSKINSYCPAKIKAMICSNGFVNVTYCSTHIGHTMDLEHLNIPFDDRKELASKITAKIPFDSIIEEVQSSGINLQRTHLLKKQDLRNIIRDFSLGSGYVPEKKRKIFQENRSKNKIIKTKHKDDESQVNSSESDLEELKKRFSDECNLILSKVTSSTQINVLLSNLKNLKPILNSTKSDVDTTGIVSNNQQNPTIAEEKKQVSPLKRIFIKKNGETRSSLEGYNPTEPNELHDHLF